MLHVFSPKIHTTIGWLMVAVVVVLSLIPTAPLPEITHGYDDKLAHALVYNVLMAWFAVSVNRSRWHRVAIWVFALGVALECGQALVPYRTASIADVIANSSGIAIGAIIALLLTTGSRRRGRAE